MNAAPRLGLGLSGAGASSHFDCAKSIVPKESMVVSWVPAAVVTTLVEVNKVPEAMFTGLDFDKPLTSIRKYINI